MPNSLASQETVSFEETLDLMRTKLTGIVPDVEIEIKAELAHKINQLKAEKNAVILGHNYMEPALFNSVPDYVGDSLELSRVSAETNADIIVFLVAHQEFKHLSFSSNKKDPPYPTVFVKKLLPPK